MKLNLLIHETTLLDFRFIGRLAIRYKYVALIIPALMITLSLYFANMAKQVHVKTVNFEHKVPEKSTTARDVSALLGEKNTDLTLEDLQAITNSWLFHKKVADLTIKHQSFDQLNFGAIGTSKTSWGAQIRNNCKTNLNPDECMSTSIRGFIPASFSIQQGSTIERYTLHAKANDTLTATTLIHLIVAAVQAERTDFARLSYLHKRDILNKLIIQKTAEVQGLGVDKIQKELSVLSVLVREANGSISTLRTRISHNNAKISTAKLKVSEMERLGSLGINDEGKVQYEKSSELENKILSLRKNIHILKNSNSGNTEINANIVAQLENDLAQSLTKMAVLEQIPNDYSQLIGSTQSSNILAKNQLKNDLKILMAKEADLSRTLTREEGKRNNLIYRLEDVKLKLTDLKPDKDYISTLQSKLISFKLLESTIVSDLVFETPNPQEIIVRKKSPTTLFFYFAMISIFFWFLAIVISFLFDDKIYTEAEFSKLSADIDIIGTTPKY